MNAHPMILPHVSRDSDELLGLSQNAQDVYRLLYDMVDGFASDQPSWRVHRWVINLDGDIFVAENLTLQSKGWRAAPLLSELPVSAFGVPNVAHIEGHMATVRERSFVSFEGDRMSLGDFIAHMEKEGLGRPSTYSAHAQQLLERDYVVDLHDVRLTPNGSSVLKLLRQSESACFDAAFTKNFLQHLDVIETGLRTAEDSLHEWLNPEYASIAAEWLDSCQIQGDVAALFYESRDEIDRNTVFWPVGVFPKELDPEIVLPADSPYRIKRAKLNQNAARTAGDEWQQYSTIERIKKRIYEDAKSEQISINHWKEIYKFDLLRRWMVGWYST